VPVPVREIVAVFHVAVFPRRLPSGLEYFKETLPLMLPPDCGAKVVVKITLCPGASVNGMLRPLMLNPFPETTAWEIVRFQYPVLFRPTDCDTLLPVGTLPKLTVEGATASCPAAVVVNRKTFNRTNPRPKHVHGES